MQCTHEQALRAINLINELIKQAFPDGARYMATQLNIHPTTTKEMYDLIQEIKQNDR